MVDYSNKDIFKEYYTGEFELKDRFGNVISVEDKTDQQIQELLQLNLGAPTYTGPVLKPEEKPETRVERKIQKEEEVYSKEILRMVNTLKYAGMSEKDINNIIPNPVLIKDPKSPLYNPSKYEQQVENYNKAKTLFNVPFRATKSITDLFKGVQELALKPITGYPGFKEGVEKLPEVLPESVISAAEKTRDFVETYTPFGTRSTAENIARNVEAYDLPEEFNKYGKDFFEKFFSAPDEYKPYPDIDPSYAVDTGLFPGERFGVLALENSAFAAPFLKAGYSISSKYAKEFEEFLVKEAKKEGIEKIEEGVLRNLEKNADSLVNKFFAERGYGKGGTILHSMFLSPRLKTGLSSQQSQKNYEIYKTVSTRLNENIIKRNDLIKANASKEQINAVERQILKDQVQSVNLFIESVPKYIRMEAPAIPGAAFLGSYFEENNFFGGQFAGEITGSILFPTAAPVVTNTAKWVNNMAADMFDAVYNAVQKDPATFAVNPIFGQQGTLIKADEGLLLMADKKAKGNPRLNIPPGYRQATDKEVNAYEKLFLGITQNVSPEAREQVINNLQKSIDDLRDVENYLIKNGLDEETAYDVTSRSFAVAAQIPAIQLLTLQNTFKLKPNDFAGFSSAVADHTDLYYRSVGLQQELKQIIDGLKPYGADKKVKELSDSLAKALLQNTNFIEGQTAQFKKIVDTQIENLVRSDFSSSADESIDILLRLEKIPELQEYQKLVFQQIDLEKQLIENTRTRMTKLAEASVDAKQYLSAQQTQNRTLLDFLQKRKAQVRLRWEQEYKIPLVDAVKNENVTDFKPILNQIENNFEKLRYDFIVKPIKGTKGAINLLPNEKQMKNVYDSLERPAAEAVTTFFSKYNISADDLITTTAEALKKDAADVTFYDVYKLYDGKSMSKQFGGGTINLSLNLNFEEAHNIKTYFDTIINNSIYSADSNAQRISSVFIPLRDNLNDGVKTYFDNAPEDINNLYKNYNSYYKENIGDVYTASKKYQPLGSNLKNIKFLGSEKTQTMDKSKDLFYSLDTLTNANRNQDYKNKLAVLYGIPTKNIENSHAGRVFLDLGDNLKNKTPEELLANEGYQAFKQALELETRKYLYQNTNIGKAIIQGIDDPNVVKDFSKYFVKTDIYTKLKELEQNSVVFVQKADGKIVQESAIDFDKIFGEFELENMYKKFPNLQPQIDEIVKNQNKQINNIKTSIQGDFQQSEINPMKIFISEYQNRFGSGFTNVKNVYSKYINNPILLDDLKKELVEGGVVRKDILKKEPGQQILTEKEFDKIIGDIMLAGLADEIGAGLTFQGSKFEYISGNKVESIKEALLNPITTIRKKYPTQIETVSKENRLDIKKLQKRLVENKDVFEKVLDEEQYDILIKLANVIEGESVGTGPQALMEGIANGLSIPSLQSRVYNVIRGIVSPTYVIGEASFLRFRKGRQAFIMELLTNKEAARNMLKILNTDKPLKQEEFRKAYNIVFSDLIAPLIAKNLLLEEEFEETGGKGKTMGQQMQDLMTGFGNE